MKIKLLLFCITLILSLSALSIFAQSEYKEVRTSQGKVIIGMDKESAMEKFGPPESVTEELWYYSNPERFFVYFTSTAITSLRLFPESCEVVTGFPLEFKALAELPNFRIEDVTSEVNLSMEEPQNFIIQKKGFIIPEEIGEYQIVASYKNMFSNPLYLTVKAQKEKESKEKERLLSLHILPHAPKVPMNTKLDFVALGTFLRISDNAYLIREIGGEVMWLTQREGNIVNERFRQIYFPSPGKVKVYCKYQDKEVETYPQVVEVNNAPFQVKEKLKHITLLPEFIIVPTAQTINLEAYATYANNRVEDITPRVNWRVKDNEILNAQKAGQFLSKSKGVTEVRAELDTLESTLSKIIVVDTKGFRGGAVLGVHGPKEPSDENVKDITEEMKADVTRIRRDFIRGEKKLVLIKIVPDYMSIPLGENRRLVALGIYSDNSQEDISLLGEWYSTNKKVVTAQEGKISTLSKGKAKVYMKFQGVESLSASIIVEDPRLLSIILSPQKSQISMKDTLHLKAEGYFSDNSRQDITPSVSWVVSDQRVIKIEQGKVKPLRFGETQVHAEYSEVKSLPVSIKIIFTLQWLLEILALIILFFILAITLLFTILYFITNYKSDNLCSLYKNPRAFIMSLYENMVGILIIFGIRHTEVILPLAYAELIEKRYVVEDRLFLRFTAKFEEAKYSQHILQSNDACLVLNEYNNFLKILFGRHRKSSLLIRYCLALLHRRPLFLAKSSYFTNLNGNDIIII